MHYQSHSAACRSPAGRHSSDIVGSLNDSDGDHFYSPGMCSVVGKGMHSIERDALEFPKQLNCSWKRLFEGMEKEPLIPLLHSSQCCHSRKFRNCWLYSGCHFETHRSSELWQWSEQSLSGSGRSSLDEFLHFFTSPNSAARTDHTAHHNQQDSETLAQNEWQERVKWNITVETIFLCCESVAVIIFFGWREVFS